MPPIPEPFILTFAPYLPMIFVAMYGCCVGSLLNVLVYRMPRGENVVIPTSRCPHCQTKLTWRENIPVLGWVLLGGRCRFCKSRISAEYPIVEAFTGALFAGLYWLFYIATPALGWIGRIAPEWAGNGPGVTWPIFAVFVGLFSVLIAMTLIDARTFTVPIELCWFASILALVGHVGCAIYVQLVMQPAGRIFRTAAVPPDPGVLGDIGLHWRWAIATPMDVETNWWWAGAGAGALAGVGVSLLLLRWGLITRSFSHYQEWEDAQHLPASPGEGEASDAQSNSTPNPSELWIAYPHARREMVREMAFLTPPVVLGWLGATLAHRYDAPPIDIERMTASLGTFQPMWVNVLAGVLMGYVLGAALVWGVRIVGSLAFGKEAMGMGDVHILAAVGACLGWIDAVLTFFLGAVVGVVLTLASRLTGGASRQTLPFGPSLAIAALLVVLGKPWIERLITAAMHANMPMNIP